MNLIEEGRKRMRRMVMSVVAALLLCLGPPGATLAQQGEEEKPRTCEEICAELAAQNCEEIDSMQCNFYIMGCLSGCEVGRLIQRK